MTRAMHWRQREANRNTAADVRRMLESHRWRVAAKAFLAEPGNERCHYCPAPAECVDHARPHKGDPALFWDRSNWRPACLSCNSSKAVALEGAFGHAPQAEWKGRKVRPGCDVNGRPLDPLHPWNKDATDAAAPATTAPRPAVPGRKPKAPRDYNDFGNGSSEWSF